MTDQYIGPYKVMREIGRGGMGAVFEAVHPQIQRRVAIKVLHAQYAQNEQLVTRFFNEARAVNIVNHPSVIQISEFAQLPDGTAYIVMEYLDGDSLGGRLKRNGGRLSVPESLRLSRQIAAALAAAHNKGIIHRDLKPDNVMIVADPEAPGGERAKILDFGIAKLAAAAYSAQNGSEPLEYVSQTRTGVMIGTPLYMAPEQCKGSGQIDDKADVYSLGVMLYRMLAGRPPFIGEGTGSVIAMHIYEPPPPIREFEASVPEDLAALIQGLLAKAPSSRPPMQQVVQALEQLRAIHASGNLSLQEPSRLSGALTPLPTPIPLGASSLGQVSTGSQTALGRIARNSGSSDHIGLLAAGPPTSTGSLGASSTHQASSVSQTYGHSAAQIAVEPRRRGVLVAAATFGTSILLGVVLFSTVALRRAVPPKAVPLELQPVVQPVRKVRFVVSSEPSGAAVLRAADSRELGNTPWQSEQPAGSGPLVLILRHPGYADHIVTIDQSANAVIREALQVLAPAPTPAPLLPPEPETRPRRGKHSNKRSSTAAAAAALTAPAAPANHPPPEIVAPPASQPTPPPVKPSTPPKEETPHARVQVVD